MKCTESIVMNKNIFPVSRIGNEKSPRLIILLCNPGGDSGHPKWLPEYTMDRDKCYKSSGMDFNTVREYCIWWNDVLSVTDEYNIKDSDILALEFYPYHTPSSKDVPKYEHWDDFAKACLEENTKLLKQHMALGVPVFAYYWGFWFKADIPGIKEYCWKSKNAPGPWSKLNDLKDFLEHENFK